METTIIIDKMIMHHVDMTTKKIIFAAKLIELQETSLEYYHTKLDKIFASPSLKNINVATLGLHVNRANVSQESDEKFISSSKETVQDLYNYFIMFEDMPTCNIVFVECKVDGVKHHIMMKLNFKLVETNVIEEDGGQMIVRVAQRFNLPSKGLNVEEAIVVNQETKEVKIIERKFMLDGKMDTYISNLYLQGYTELNDRQKISIMEKSIKRINREYNNNDIDTLALTKHKMVESIVEENQINPIQIAIKVFEKDYGAQTECIEMIKEAGVVEEDTVNSSFYYPQKLGKCRIFTDTEVEIIINAQDYIQGNYIRKQENPDGSISLILDNIHELTMK